MYTKKSGVSDRIRDAKPALMQKGKLAACFARGGARETASAVPTCRWKQPFCVRIHAQGFAACRADQVKGKFRRKELLEQFAAGQAIPRRCRQDGDFVRVAGREWHALCLIFV
jgi:hypothetical protein